MKILGLEFSSAHRSAALVCCGEGVSQRQAERSETGPGGIRAVQLIEGVLRDTLVERQEIECVAVGIGPGSYTGIRAALAFVQGWHIAAPAVRIAPVPSADCIAEQARRDGLRGLLRVVIDAQRGELYVAGYQLDAQATTLAEPLRLCLPGDLRANSANAAPIAGPEAQRWFPEGIVIYPTASILCDLAWARDQFVPAEKVEPIYLRDTAFVKAPPPLLTGL